MEGWFALVDKGLGWSAFVIATNCAIVWGGIRVIRVWWSFVRNEWAELKKAPLGLLPLSILWLVLWLAVEAWYFAAARLVFESTQGEFNMWMGDWVFFILLIRTSVLIGLVAHVVPKWRAEGLGDEAVLRKSVWFGTEIFGVFLLVFWVLF